MIATFEDQERKTDKDSRKFDSESGSEDDTEPDRSPRCKRL